MPQDNKPYKVSLYEGKSRKDNTPYTAILVEVGTWSKLIFAKSGFELDYLKKNLSKPVDSSESTINLDDEDDDRGMFN